MSDDLDRAALEQRLPPWTRELLACLTDRRRDAFVLREAAGLTFDEISAALDISPSRARQLHDAAVHVVTDAARRAALLSQHAPAVVPHVPPVHATQKCAVPLELQATLTMPLDALALAPRAANCLRNAGIDTVGALIVNTDSEILRIMNLGRKMLREIKQALAPLGLHLGMEASEASSPTLL